MYVKTSYRRRAANYPPKSLEGCSKYLYRRPNSCQKLNRESFGARPTSYVVLHLVVAAALLIAIRVVVVVVIISLVLVFIVLICVVILIMLDCAVILRSATEQEVDGALHVAPTPP